MRGRLGLGRGVGGGGGGPWSPPGTVRFHINETSAITDDGTGPSGDNEGRISQINDLSAAAAHAVPVAPRPYYDNTGLNGKRILNFTALQPLLATLPAGFTGGVAFAVVKFSGANQTVFELTPAASQVVEGGLNLFNSAALAKVVAGRLSNHYGTAPYTAGSWAVIAARYTGNLSRVLVDGATTADNADAVTIPACTKLHIGSLADDTSFGLVGSLAELILCDGSISDEEIAEGVAALDAKWLS